MTFGQFLTLFDFLKLGGNRNYWSVSDILFLYQNCTKSFTNCSTILTISLLLALKLSLYALVDIGQ